jgi:MFS family permease
MEEEQTETSDAGAPIGATTHLTPDPLAAAGRPATDERRTRRLARSVALDLSPLRVSRDYRLLFAGYAVTFFGSMMTFVVLPVQLYELTGSTLAVGLLSAVEFVPMLIMAFVGGALADAVDRRKMVRATEALLALGTLILVYNSLLDEPRAWVLYVCAAGFATLNGLQRPSLDALVPRLVPAELIPAAAALNTIRTEIGMIGGPVVGGLLVASFGPAVAYGVDFLTFIICLALLWRMRAVPPPAGADQPSVRSVVEGLRYAWRRRELMGTYLVDINAMFFGMPMALFPAVAAGLNASGSIGLFYSAPAVGALLISLTSGWTRHINRHGLAVALAAGGWGLAVIGFGLAPTLWWALCFLVLAGAADMVSGLFRATIWNQTIPDHLRGRLAGIEMVSYMSGPQLGNLRSGVAAKYFGVEAAVVSGGVLCVAGTALLAALLPSFLRYDGREGLARKRAEEEARAAVIGATPEARGAQENGEDDCV